MAVYVDDAIWPWAGRRWCHLIADDVDELHGFAFRLGLQRMSYQGPPRTTKPHYDITGFERSRAIRLGAIPSTRHDVVEVLRRLRARLAEAEKRQE
ncbi:MAG: DUF4031 domain-containing protein [Rhizobiaceae bacterium]